MTIEVNQISNINPICVLFEGECNHADVVLSQEDFGNVGYVNGELDYIDNWQTVLLCNKCKAYRFSEDEPWEGVTVLPVINVRNFGKPIKEFEDVA